MPESAGGPFFDRANGQGMIIGPLKQEGAYDWEEWENRVVLEDETHSLPDWARFYDGKWGMDAIMDLLGFTAPRFPSFQNNSDMWYHPAKWAGITEAAPPATTPRVIVIMSSGTISVSSSIFFIGLTASKGSEITASMIPSI